MGGFYISMVSVALQYMPRVFKGQMDKTGREPQFMHSLRVFDRVKTKSNSEMTQVAALLHDVIEDTDQTVDMVRRAFSEYPAERVERMIEIMLSVTRGYIRRETHEMVFSPPPAHLVCDCDKSKGRRCVNDAHIYDKEQYRAFVMRSKKDPEGRIVKISDIEDNSTPGRIEGLSEDEKGIVEERYVPALAFLRDNKATEFFTPKQLARPCKHCLKPFGEHMKTAERTCPASPTTRFKGFKN
jgi:hypothetical protein